jgi:hypothetical protein
MQPSKAMPTAAFQRGRGDSLGSRLRHNRDGRLFGVCPFDILGVSIRGVILAMVRAS